MAKITLNESDFKEIDKVKRYTLNPVEKRQIIKKALRYLKKDIRNDVKKALSKTKRGKILESVLQGFINFDITTILRLMPGLCDKCGECCRLSDPINLSKEDVELLEQHLGNFMNLQELIDFKEGRYLFKKTKPCHFLKGNLCSIYEIRPSTCRSFPFVELKDGRFVPIKYGHCKLIDRYLIMKTSSIFFYEYLKKTQPQLGEAMEKEMEGLFQEFGLLPTLEDTDASPDVQQANEIGKTLKLIDHLDSEFKEAKKNKK